MKRSKNKPLSYQNSMYPLWKGLFTLCIASFFFSPLYAQIDKYQYQRKIEGTSEEWHKINLPNDLFSKINNELSDIRIYHIHDQDTLEVPFLLKINHDEVVKNIRSFKLINQTQLAKFHYYTFALPEAEQINRIMINFEEQNFDWKITMEGSQNQKQWFTIFEDKRIISIFNNHANYTFSTLNFDDVSYQFLRLKLKNKKKPTIAQAHMEERIIKEGIYQDIQVIESRTEDKDLKQSVIDLDFQQKIPISYIHLKISDDFDYYRPLVLQYLTDSVKTEKGWKYNYRTIQQNYLSSLEENTFKFKNTLTSKFRITILNHDNQALNIAKVEAKGNLYELQARMNGALGDYYLVYGNDKAYAPNYDIVNFKDKIPETLTTLNLGAEEDKRLSSSSGSPLFENQAWLWGVMLVIIVVLGWFSVKMLTAGNKTKE